MANNFTQETKIHYSHQIYATVRNVRFKEMEYNIPIEHVETCIKALKALIEEKEYYIFFPVECRFVKADDITKVIWRIIVIMKSEFIGRKWRSH